jgi:hypothetical protein
VRRAAEWNYLFGALSPTPRATIVQAQYFSGTNVLSFSTAVSS